LPGCENAGLCVNQTGFAEMTNFTFDRISSCYHIYDTSTGKGNTYCVDYKDFVPTERYIDGYPGTVASSCNASFNDQVCAECDALAYISNISILPFIDCTNVGGSVSTNVSFEFYPALFACYDPTINISTSEPSSSSSTQPTSEPSTDPGEGMTMPPTITPVEDTLAPVTEPAIPPSSSGCGTSGRHMASNLLAVLSGLVFTVLLSWNM
jgi:hypothetical protein